MRLVNMYLVAYSLLIVGALAALWYGGALQQIPALWVLGALVAAIGLGVVLAVASRRPGTVEE